MKLSPFSCYIVLDPSILLWNISSVVKHGEGDGEIGYSVAVSRVRTTAETLQNGLQLC
jgi:hypothetical protein